MDLAVVNSSLKEAVRGTKEQTSAIVDKLSDELEYTRRQMLFISENIVDSVLLVDDSGKIIDSNTATLKMFGCSRSDIIGRYITDVLSVDASGQNSFNAIAKNANGVMITLEINVSHLQTKSSHSYLYVIKNVSEKREFYKKINDLTTFQSSLLNSLPIPVYWKDDAFRFIGCNKAFETYMGVVEADIVGKNVFDVLKNDVNNCVFLDTKDQELLNKPDGFVQILESKFKNVNGVTQSAMHYNTPLNDSETKSFNGMIGILIDTTDIQMFKNIYSLIFDLIPNPISYNDKMFNILECNKAFCEFVKLPRDKIINSNIYELIDNIEDVETRNLFVSSIAIDNKYAIDSNTDETSIIYETSNSVFKLTKTPLKDLDLSIVGMTTVIADVTDEIRSNKNRVCRDCTVNKVLNKNEEPLFIVDDAGMIIFVNKSFCNMIDKSDLELLNTNIFEYISAFNLTVERIHESKWEDVAVIKGNITRIVNIKIIPVINSKKHGIFACGIITGF